MIGKLRGLVDTIAEDHVVLDVGGVGYEVFCPARVLGHLPRPGEPVALVIETVVREDAIRLYGFTSPGERAWFRLLTSVQGVGAKVALAILGVLAPDDLATAIALGDKVALSRAPGVGKRLAERLVVELKQAAGELALPAALAGSGGVQVAAGASDPALADAVSALVNLGYGEAQARGAVLAARAAGHADAGAATLIRQALKELAR
ncbi:Holliday junction branch migration protein RuvA [Pseudoxanthobacter sp. M-2]|uniref:Holliday junction branch migration protein RuvA n=1 Tax=Pseudoxanthobacter sp. M-2 TaxID=3078754 RepID=UPI0038FCA808